ncbi:TPA: flagellar hook-basal body complex protein FliE [Candidatus Poribacteria bacterium]|nr:flagellar hook-basal body complex protein FliE [Candidatus Poribacteria bacterium]HIA67270.1 flagellar hook-basal body complex protein FliE [Candidatus Poribacteria bacterium]HIB88184.1 flagellar hook-basal body complex protein FliE [Candidatus Poribacteria bacterium]HIC03880.1 flagellar hook-basal body complex protein FliE [Candidatus Poribacteria bacterium]HIN30349.1 flagellar hook-basal body complex protein FliE [Candidatus Poribacteria bacterium]
MPAEGNIGVKSIDVAPVYSNFSSSGVSFKKLLQNNLNKVNEMQLLSHQESIKFATGESDNLHELMITLEEAKLALQLAVEIRNKILDAYQEILRMQI